MKAHERLLEQRGSVLTSLLNIHISHSNSLSLSLLPFQCWWDHWILDLILTNWVGTWLGMKTCEYFEMKHYSWRGVGEIPSYRGKLKRGIQQFTPYSWTKFEWSVSTRTFKNFVAVIGLLFLVKKEVERRDREVTLKNQILFRHSLLLSHSYNLRSCNANSTHST